MFWGRFRACIQKFFITFKVTIFFFRDVYLLCSSRWLQWVKWLWFFFNWFLNCKRSCVFLFFTRISLTRDSGGEIIMLCCCVEKINHLRESWKNKVQKNEVITATTWVIFMSQSDSFRLHILVWWKCTISSRSKLRRSCDRSASKTLGDPHEKIILRSRKKLFPLCTQWCN